MKTVHIPEDYQHTSPAGAEVRVLIGNTYGGIAHCTLKNEKISKVVRHKTVSEFWHVLSGKGAIWRRNDAGETITSLEIRENNQSAIALYEKVGFVREGLHKNAVRIDGKYENHISMALLFE